MTVPEPTKRQYGLTTDVSVKMHEGGQMVVIGGTGEKSQQWSHVLTQRAAQVLWFKLTQLLYPDKANIVTALATTAPLRPLGSSDAVTTHVEAVKCADQHYSLVGWVGRDTWMFLLSELDARRLWAALDTVLFPVGWEGRETKRKTLN